MHSGEVLRLRSLPAGFDPTDRASAFAYLEERKAAGEIPMGLFYVNEAVPDVHELNETSSEPLVSVPYKRLCPGSSALEELQQRFV